MALKKSELDEILERLRSLPREYWEKAFTEIEGARQDRVDDLLAELVYLFDLARQKLDTAISLYYTRYGRDGVVDYATGRERLTRPEINELKSDMETVRSELESEGLDFDADLKRRVKAIGTGTTRMQGLKLRIEVLIFQLYSVAGKRIYDHMGNVATEFHARTIFEVFKAAGYGSRGIHRLKGDELDTLLGSVWRSTGETFDDAVWRYGRTHMAEASGLVGKVAFTDRDLLELAAAVTALLRPKLRDLSNLARTDSTYLSTEGQARAFGDLRIDEAVFTAVLDDRTTEWCREADGNVIPVDDIRPWENAPPLHYNCRSTMVPIVKSVDWLTGDTYEVEGDFDGWYKTWD